MVSLRFLVVLSYFAMMSALQDERNGQRQSFYPRMVSLKKFST